MSSLLDFALLQLLCLLKSEQNQSERVRKTVYRSAKSSNDPAPGRTCRDRPMVLASIREAGTVVRIIRSLWTERDEVIR